MVVIPKKKKVKRSAKRKVVKRADPNAEITKLYAEFEKEKKRIDLAVAKFDHKDLNQGNRNFYQTFFGIATIVLAAGITTFVLVNSGEGNLTAAAVTNVGITLSSVFQSVYFNMVLGGIFGLLFIVMLHMMYSRKHKQRI